MTTEDQVTFSLRYFCRYDEEVRAFVGYVPRLQVYAQSPTEDGLQQAITATALRFILTCVDKHMLGDIMREAQMKEVSAIELAASAPNDDEPEFVSIHGYKECANPIELTVPFSAFALDGAIA
jgi:hypothetical protein